MTSSDIAPASPVAPHSRKHWPQILLAIGAVVAIVGVTVAVTRATTSPPVVAGPTVNAAAAPVIVAPSASTSVAASPTVAPNSTGYLSKKVGERAGLGSGAEIPVEFWITKINVDTKCAQYGQRKPGSHSVVLDVTVKTHEEDGYGSIASLPGLLNEFAFSTEGATTGVKNQGEWDPCHPEVKRLPNVYALNSTYTGQIAFATPDASGKLQLNGEGMDNVKGWEWQF